MITACKSLLSKRTYDESHGKPSKTEYQNKNYKDGYSQKYHNQGPKTWAVQSLHRSLVVPLMDIEFHFKTKFMQKNDGLRFEQIIDKSYSISV